MNFTLRDKDKIDALFLHDLIEAKQSTIANENNEEKYYYAGLKRQKSKYFGSPNFKACIFGKNH
jgi:hypothetical protein